MLHVACDVCRRRYQVDDARLGTTLTCKECSVPFDVSRENFVDPDEPEPNSDEAEQEAPESEWKQVWACTVNGVGATGVIIALVGMLWLLFRDPREVGGPTASAATPSVAQSRPTTPPMIPSLPRIQRRPDENDIGFGGPTLVLPADPNSGAMTGGFSPPATKEDVHALAESLAAEVKATAAERSVERAEPLPPLAPLTINEFDPPRVRPDRTFRLLGSGFSRVERVVLVPVELPPLVAGFLNGFEIVSDEELIIPIGRRSGAYVVVLERADATFVSVPADAQIVTAADESLTIEPGAFVVVRDGGRFNVDQRVCCLVERGGQLNCLRGSNWGGWFAGGSVVTGRVLPPTAWITPETTVQVTVPDRGRLTVTTPRIIGVEVATLVTADAAAAETPEFTGRAPGRRSRAETAEQGGGIPANGRGQGINYNGPGAIPSSGRSVDDETPLAVGQIVQVQDHRSWYAADVLRVNNDGTVRIHYRGWSGTWDEDVPRSRIQLAHEN